MFKDTQDPLEFREQIFELYGFTLGAREFIRNNSGIVVHSFSDFGGGGYWHPDQTLVELFTAQHQAAVHELSHTWWHRFRAAHPEMKMGLAKDVVKLADMDVFSSPQYKAAIQFAHSYVYGVGDWIGMYGNADYENNTAELPADIHNLTIEDFLYKINDWEIFAGFCSWTMGRYKTGPHILPQFLWKYLSTLFTGAIKIVPYYIDGGHP